MIVRNVLFILGILLSAMMVAMVVPLLWEVLCTPTSHRGEFAGQEFLISLFLTGLVGALLALANRPHEPIVLKVRDAFLFTTLSWGLCSLFSGLPFYFCSALSLSFIDSWFESVSALTTTGATILTKLDMAPRGILLWRAILQWLGGIGIVVMAMMIFPILRIGGMQLFRSEFSDRSEKILPRVSQISSAIITTYTFFTFLCLLFLWFAGMSFFDALCHAMSTLSTGGFSTKDQSVGAYNSVVIELIIAFFMLIGSVTFTLFVKAWHGDYMALLKNTQVRVFLGVTFLLSFVLALWNWLANQTAFLTSLRYSFFNVVSVMSTSGFSSADYTAWGSFAASLIFFASFLGGCTGSTSGGIKIFRFQVLYALTKTHLHQLLRPHGVYLATYQGQKISDVISTSVFVFIGLYFFCVGVTTVVLSALGLDFVTSISSAVTCVGNVGPGLGSIVGPAGTFFPLSPETKVTLIVAMIMGRLELITMLVLLMPSYWKD